MPQPREEADSSSSLLSYVLWFLSPLAIKRWLLDQTRFRANFGELLFFLQCHLYETTH
jgi:hypothetical protein